MNSQVSLEKAVHGAQSPSAANIPASSRAASSLGLLVQVDGEPRSEEAKSVAPYHVFGKSVVWLMVALVTLAGSLSGLSSSVFYPAQGQIAEDLGVDVAAISQAITSYLIAQGFAPSFWGPLADLYGRRIVLIASLTVYVVANIIIAKAPNVHVLLVCRAAQAIGSSSTVSVSSAVIADITSPAERATYLSTSQGIRQASMALGPVIGGVLCAQLGWRSMFWFLTTMALISLTSIVLLLPETSRKMCGNGSTMSSRALCRPLLGSLLPYMRSSYVNKRFLITSVGIVAESQRMLQPRKRFTWSIFARSFRLVCQRDVACALAFGALVYTPWVVMMAVTPTLLSKAYHFNTLQTGLAFLANGSGCLVGAITAGRTSKTAWQAASDAWQHERGQPKGTPMPRPTPTSFPIERARLSSAPTHLALMVLGFLTFGFSISGSNRGLKAQWMAPLLLQFLIGFCNSAVLANNNTLVIDLFPKENASASAAVNLTRNLTAAIGVSLGDRLLNAVGDPGILGAIWAGIAIAGAIPLAVHTWRGPHWRIERDAPVVVIQPV